MRATQRPVALSLTNATALLWRLDTLGFYIGDRWRDLAALWEGHADGKCLVFTRLLQSRSGCEITYKIRSVGAGGPLLQEVDITTGY